MVLHIDSPDSSDGRLSDFQAESHGFKPHSWQTIFLNPMPYKHAE